MGNIALNIVATPEEAWGFNIEFDQCHALAVHHGHPIEDKPRYDHFELVKFAKMIGEIKLPELQTDDGNEIAKIADALLRDCVTEIMAGVEAL